MTISLTGFNSLVLERLLNSCSPNPLFVRRDGVAVIYPRNDGNEVRPRQRPFTCDLQLLLVPTVISLDCRGGKSVREGLPGFIRDANETGGSQPPMVDAGGCGPRHLAELFGSWTRRDQIFWRHRATAANGFD
ncbi:MAG: hypothetical protein ABIH17_07660 [Pseudomonadota bacterium]